jgi:hypothetical protein
MGKLTISMAIFNSYVSLPEGTPSGRRLAAFQQQLLRQRGAGPAEGLTALCEGATL